MSKSYQPLHHKYRPQNFDGLVGQDAIAATLKQAIKTSRIAPAYLFSGPRGTGKTSSARILAKSLNCLSTQSPTTQPCGNCDLCKGITTGAALDVIEIDAASNTGVDNIRELIERSRFVPVQARWKVYVIDECHMLSTAAFNALLKTLEEPPQKVVFILATTDPQRVLPTILSRCQRFDFRRISLESIEKHLVMIAKNESISIDPDAIEIIAQRAQGGLRDAESLLDQLSLLPGPVKADNVFELVGAVPEEELIKLVKALIKEEPINLLEACRKLLNRGREPIALLQGLAKLLRDLLIAKVAPDRPELLSVSSQFRSHIKTLTNIVTEEQILEWQSNLKGSENQIRNSMQPRLWIEILLLSLLKKSKDINKVKEKEYLPELNKKNENSPNINNLNKQKIFQDRKDCNEQLKEPIPKKIDQGDSIHERNSTSNNLSELWQQILGSLELPSTKMLLSQQAELVHIDQKRAVIHVSGNWIGMVQSRAVLLAKAISIATGSEKTLIIEEQKQAKSSNVPKSIQKEVETISNQIKTKEKVSDDSKNASLESKDTPLNNIENNAKKLAEFFNGEVVEDSESNDA